MEQNPVQTPTPSSNFPPINNIPENTTPVKSSSTKLVTLMFVLIVLLLGTIVFLFYRNSQLKKQITAPPTSSPTVSATSDPTVNWETHSGKEFQFKYPSGWSVREHYSDYFEGQEITIDNPTGVVSIEVTPFSSTYGFSGNTKTIKNAIKFSFVGKEYSAVETIVENHSVYVNQYVDVSGISYAVMFGSGYPVNADDDASLEEYQKEKSTILQILSTFKFTDPETTNLKSRVEDLELYEKSQSRLSWSKCLNEPDVSVNLKSAVAETDVFVREIDGVHLAYTGSFDFFSAGDIAKFTTCEAGAYYPLHAAKSYIIWVSACSTGMAPDNPKCEDTLTQIKQLYK